MLVAQVVAVCLNGAEGDAAQAVNLEDQLAPCWGGDDKDVGLLAYTDLIAYAVDGTLVVVRVKRKVVETAIGEAVAVVFCITQARNEADFCKGGDGARGAAAEVRLLPD